VSFPRKRESSSPIFVIDSGFPIALRASGMTSAVIPRHSTTQVLRPDSALTLSPIVTNPSRS
jgi:hypothetical protein